MDPEVLAFAQVMAILVPSIGVLAAIGVVTLRVVRRTIHQPSIPPWSVDDDRFRRLEHAVDSIAVEVERISEAQRYATKLLTEKSNDSALS